MSKGTTIGDRSVKAEAVQIARSHARLHSRLAIALAAILLVAGLHAETVSEKVLGQIKLEGTPGPGIVVAYRGSDFARRERVAGGERYTTVDSPGETFDAILPGAVWIRNRLVYYARKAGQTFLVDAGKKQLIRGVPTSPAAAARFLPSQDRQHFLAFVSDGTYVWWYLDGKRQADKYTRLALTPIEQPLAVSLFVAAQSCDYYLIGQSQSSAAKWDLVHWASAVHDATAVFVYGERASKKLLRRNGKIIFQGQVESFERSADGKVWMAVADRSADGTDRIELLRDGMPISEAPVDLTRQRLRLSADGSAWAWQIIDQDYVGSTLRQVNKPERRVDLEIADFFLSDDGGRLAIIMKDVQQGQIVVEVDSVKLQPIGAMNPRSFRFGPGNSYAFVRSDGEKVSIVSHLGQGPAFDTVSAVWFLSDGRPAYIGSRPGAHVAVIGTVEVPLAASDIHHLDSLRLEGERLRVLGTRGTEVVDFTISAQ